MIGCAGWLPEGVASATLIMVNSVVQIIFLAVPTKINGSSQWMNWLTFATFAIGTVPLVMIRVEYARTELDCAAAECSGEGGKSDADKAEKAVTASRFDAWGCI